MTEEIFTAAVRRNTQRLFVLALSFMRNREDAQDVLQSVFLKLWNGQKPFENAEHIDRWLTRVTVNECRSLLRSPFRRNRVELDGETADTFEQESDYDLFLVISTLPPKLRAVVHLFYYEDMSVRDMAALLHLRESTVKTRLCRARAQIKDKLEVMKDE